MTVPFSVCVKAELCFLCRCCCQDVRGLNTPSGSGFSPLRAFLTKCETFCSRFFFLPPSPSITSDVLDFWTTLQTKHTHKQTWVELGSVDFCLVIYNLCRCTRPNTDVHTHHVFRLQLPHRPSFIGHWFIIAQLANGPMLHWFEMDFFLWKFLQQTADYLWQGIILLLSARTTSKMALLVFPF